MNSIFLILAPFLSRLFVLLAPVLLSACITAQPYPQSIPLVTPVPPPQVRPPQIGQQWVYQVRNVFNQELVDVVTEKVIAIEPQVRIARSSQNTGPLPDEIQDPWGYVLQDPYWSPPQVFLTAIPLWPEKLVPGWSRFMATRYQVLGYPDGSYYWGFNLQAVQWEQLSVPAGTFTTFKYHTEAPYFQSNDVFRLTNYRQADVWFVPEIGRWAVRRGFGRYLSAGMSWPNALWEDYLEWELVSWK
jgi:hypothetical protein